MSAHEVVVVDYGAGNLLSVQRALEYCGAKVLVTSAAEDIISAERVILPGVGAFSDAMKALLKLDLVSPLRQLPNLKTPLLGICLGMQLLLNESEEFGTNAGLGLISGKVTPLSNRDMLGRIQKIPHIGWNGLHSSLGERFCESQILTGIEPGDSLYFAHSFMANLDESRCNIAYCVYGGYKIPAVIQRGSILGCQFHPEKSGMLGLKILKNFISL